MKHIIIPTGGLANRIRVILSALQWQNDYGEKVSVWWRAGSELACRFEDIFMPVDEIKEIGSERIWYFRLMKKLYKYHLIPWRIVFDDYQYNAVNQYVRNAMGGGKMMCRSYSRFYEGSAPDYHQVFRLNPFMQQQVALVQKQLPPATIGVHIRRTDNIDSIRQSPLEAFEKRIVGYLRNHPDATFYLATDDYDVQTAFRNRFGERIIIRNGPLVRDSKEGILHAVVELYMLAACKEIWGSYCSSYSELAASIGNIPLIIIK